MKTNKSFGEIWSELTEEQSEYLKGYINRQRIDAINIHKKVSAKQIEKLEADKAELLEALKYSNRMLKNSKDAMYDENYIESLIQKMKQ